MDPVVVTLLVAGATFQLSASGWVVVQLLSIERELGCIQARLSGVERQLGISGLE